jgi:hypothetical protein
MQHTISPSCEETFEDIKHPLSSFFVKITRYGVFAEPKGMACNAPRHRWTESDGSNSGDVVVAVIVVTVVIAVIVVVGVVLVVEVVVVVTVAAEQYLLE